MLFLILATAVVTLTISAEPFRSPSRLHERKQIRQDNELEDLDTYIYQLNTARFALDLILQTPVSCDPTVLIEIYNEQGYDGRYAEQLLCAAAAGINLFPDVRQAFDGVDTALTGLRNLRDPLGLGGIQTEVTCEEIDVAVLYQAGLDGDAIRALICDAEDDPPSASASSSLAVIETSSSSVAALTSSPSTASTSPSSTSNIAVITSQASNTSTSITPGSATAVLTSSSVAGTPRTFSGTVGATSQPLTMPTSSLSNSSSSAPILTSSALPSPVSTKVSQSNATVSIGQESSDGTTNITFTFVSSLNVSFAAGGPLLLSTSLRDNGSTASLTCFLPSSNATSSVGTAGTGVPSPAVSATTVLAKITKSTSTVQFTTSSNSTVSNVGSLVTITGFGSGLVVTLRPVQTANGSFSTISPTSEITSRLVGSPAMTTRSPTNSTRIPAPSTANSTTPINTDVSGSLSRTSAHTNLTTTPGFTVTNEGRSGASISTPFAVLTSMLTRNASSTNIPMSALPPTVPISSSISMVIGNVTTSLSTIALSTSGAVRRP